MRYYRISTGRLTRMKNNPQKNTQELFPTRSTKKLGNVLVTRKGVLANYYGRKTISISCSECVFVALIIQKAMPVPRIFICPFRH